jgi:hypothetical protein
MAQITKMLGVAIADSDAGRISRAQLLSIFQEAIDNGDVLSNENRQYVVTVVMPLVDAGILKRSDHLDQFAEQMNRAIRERVALLRAGSNKRHPIPTPEDAFAANRSPIPERKTSRIAGRGPQYRGSV